MREKQQERRRYFRVTDYVGLSVKILSESERELTLTGAAGAPADILEVINSEIRDALQSIRARDEETAALIALLNKKLDLLFADNTSDASKVGKHLYRNELVNISACGIAFAWATDLVLNQALELGIKLYPSEEVVSVMASVVGSERRDTFSSQLSQEEQKALSKSPYWIRANFEEIGGSGQEVLIQHVIQRQAIELQRKRQEGSS